MRDGTTAEGRVAESGPGDRLSDERRSERSEESGVQYSPGSELETLAQSASEGEPVPVPRLRFGLVPSPSAAWGLGWLSNGVLLSYAICCLLVGFGVLAAWSWNSPAFGPRAAQNIFRAGRESRRHRPADCRHDQPLGRLRLGRSELRARGNGHPAGLLLLSRLRPAGDYIQHRSQGIDRRAGDVRRGRPRRRFSAIGSRARAGVRLAGGTPAPNGGRRSIRGPGSDRPSGPVCLTNWGTSRSSASGLGRTQPIAIPL